MKGKSGPPSNSSRSLYKDKEKPTQIRYSNITAAKGLFTLVTFFEYTLCHKNIDLFIIINKESVNTKDNMSKISFSSTFFLQGKGRVLKMLWDSL